MPSESLKLFRLLRFRYRADAPVFVDFYTDEAGGSYALRETWTLALTSGKELAKLVFSHTTKGHQAKIVFRPAGKLWVYGSGEVYARRLGRAASDWAWHAIEIVPTSEALTELKIPIPATPEDYSSINLPIPATPEDYSEVRVPVPSTPEEYSSINLPIPATREELIAVDIPLPSTPKGPVLVALEMDE